MSNLRFFNVFVKGQATPAPIDSSGGWPGDFFVKRSRIAKPGTERPDTTMPSAAAAAFGNRKKEQSQSCASPPAQGQVGQMAQAVQAIEAVQQGQQMFDTAEKMPWASWPAALIDSAGHVSAQQARVHKTLAGVLQPQSSKLTDSANRRLWSMFDTKQTGQQWKVLDPVFWPFIGIVGWTPQHADCLQVVVWDLVHVPWQVDESWRQILTSTAAVRSRRRRRVA